MTDKPKFGIVTVCDAAYRDYFTNKAIIAGHYSGDIVSTQFPLALSATFYVELLNPDKVARRLEFEIVINGTSKGGSIVEIDQSNSEPAMIFVAAPPLLFEEPGELQLRAKFGDAKSLAILRKTVRTA